LAAAIVLIPAPALAHGPATRSDGAMTHDGTMSEAAFFRSGHFSGIFGGSGRDHGRWGHGGWNHHGNGNGHGGNGHGHGGGNGHGGGGGWWHGGPPCSPG